MNPLGDRMRAEELARLLEGAVAGPSSTTGGYAALATRLRTVGLALEQPQAMRPEFRVALRQRLLAVASVHAANAPASDAVTQQAPISALQAAVTWTRTWKAQRGIALTAGAMAGVVAFTGVGVASSHSLPGQPFYGLKRAAEGLQLDLAGSDTTKGTKHLEFAATRLREVRALAAGESQLALAAPGTASAGGYASGGSLADRITDTLHDFDTETNKGRDLLEAVYRRTGKVAPLRILATFSTQQQSRLAGLIPDLPAGTANAAQTSLELVTEVGATATQLIAIGACTDACNPATGGPVLPSEPVPAPGTSASPSLAPDNNGVPGCVCGEPTPTPTPTPTIEPTESPEPEPTDSASPSPTPTPTPSPTSSPTGLPIPLPTILPTGLPTGTPLPTVLPTLLPLVLPSILPTLLPGVTPS